VNLSWTPHRCSRIGTGDPRSLAVSSRRSTRSAKRTSFRQVVRSRFALAVGLRGEHRLAGNDGQSDHLPGDDESEEGTMRASATSVLASTPTSVSVPTVGAPNPSCSRALSTNRSELRQFDSRSHSITRTPRSIAWSRRTSASPPWTSSTGPRQGSRAPVIRAASSTP
jgi:hypothetical protein